MAKLHAAIAAPLDDKLYRLDADEIAFYKAKTGIHDEAALKEHVVKVQQDAYQVSIVVGFSLRRVRCSTSMIFGRSSRIFVSAGSPSRSTLSWTMIIL